MTDMTTSGGTGRDIAGRISAGLALVAICGTCMAMSTPRINTSATGGSTNIGQAGFGSGGDDDGDGVEDGINKCTANSASDAWLKDYNTYLDAYVDHMSKAKSLHPDSFKAFVRLNNNWIPIQPVPIAGDIDGDGIPDPVDNPFPNNPTIVYYAFLADSMLDIEWVEGVDEVNTIGAVDPDSGEPLDTDQIPERWDNPNVILDIIPPPLPEDTTEPGVSDALTALGLGAQVWGAARPAFGHPDGEAVWTYAQSTWGPISGNNTITFEDTFDGDQVVDEELQNLMGQAMNIISRAANIVFIQRNPDVDEGYPFEPTGDPLNPLASLISPGGAVNDRRFDPSDDFPWILIVNATDARTGSTGNFAAGFGLNRFPVEIDYQLDDLNGDGFPDAVDLGLGGSSFFVAGEQAVGNAPAGMITADVSEDGFPELITANLFDGTLSFLAGVDGAFAGQSTINVGGGPSDVAASDFDNDGDIDLVVTQQSAGSVTVLLENSEILGGSAPVFASTQVALGAGTSPTQVIIGDVDGAPGTDIVTANTGGNTLSVLTNNGAGGFAVASTLNIPSPGGIHFIDANEDGARDIVATSLTSSLVRLFTNDGAGNFTATNVATTSTSPTAIGVDDLNNDGFEDLLVLNTGSDSMTAFLGDGAGNFTQAGQPTTVVSGPSSLVFGAFNGDEFVDVAVTGSTSGNVTIFSGVGDGSFAPAAILPGPNDDPLLNPSDILTFDFGGDGVTDLVVMETGADAVNLILQIPPAAGDGIVDAIDLSAGGGAPGDGSPDVVDTNGDGIGEIVIRGITYLDITGDGIPDSPDRDNNGVPDDRNGVDLDGDGVLDDANGDGIFDGDGIPDPTPFPFFFGRFLEPQPIILINMETRSVGVGIHEILHTLGYIHEHQRPDRDQFITVLEENITIGDIGQFSRNLTVPDPGYISDEYDFESIMHYSSFAFSNGRGPTIIVNDEFRAEFGDEIGQRGTLSDIDVQSLADIFGENPDNPFPWFFGKNPNCPVDVNEDGFQSPADIILYLDLWNAGDIAADVNEDGAVDANDIQAFYAALVTSGMGPCTGGGPPTSVGNQIDFRRSQQIGGQ